MMERQTFLSRLVSCPTYITCTSCLSFNRLYDQTDCTKASPYSQYYRAYYCFIVSGGSQQWIRSGKKKEVLFFFKLFRPPSALTLTSLSFLPFLWCVLDLGEMVLESYSDDSCSVDSVLSEDVVVTLNACQAATSNATLYTFNTAPSLATNTLLSFVLVVSALLLLF